MKPGTSVGYHRLGNDRERVAEGHFGTQQNHGVIVGKDNAQHVVRRRPVRYRRIVTGIGAGGVKPLAVLQIHAVPQQGHSQADRRGGTGSRRLNQTLFQRHDHSDPARSHAEFSANVTKVVIHTGLGALDNLGDLPGRLANGAPLQDFLFPGSELDRAGLLALLWLETDLGGRCLD